MLLRELRLESLPLLNVRWDHDDDDEGRRWCIIEEEEEEFVSVLVWWRLLVRL